MVRLPFVSARGTAGAVAGRGLSGDFEPEERGSFAASLIKRALRCSGVSFDSAAGLVAASFVITSCMIRMRRKSCKRKTWCWSFYFVQAVFGLAFAKRRCPDLDASHEKSASSRRRSEHERPAHPRLQFLAESADGCRCACSCPRKALREAGG